MKRRRVVITPQARHDTVRIVEWYRSEFGGRTANKVLNSLTAAMKATATKAPESSMRGDLPVGYYRSIVKAHLVIFQFRENDVLIVRVIHGARDPFAALGQFRDEQP